MTVEITITGYEFSELGEEAKQRVIERNRDYAAVDEWWDSTYEYWKEELERLGFHNAKINFSGFYSQGDGASFEADIHIPKLVALRREKMEAAASLHEELSYYEDLVRYCKEMEDPFLLEVQRTQYHHYVHANTVTVQRSEYHLAYFDCGDCEGCEGNGTCDIHELAEYQYDNLADKKWIIKHVRDLCKQIYDDLEKEYEYLTSDKYIIEVLTEYVDDIYDEDGDVIKHVPPTPSAS